MDKITKDTKKTAAKSYNLNSHDRDYKMEQMREKQYQKAEEKWQEQQYRTNWDNIDMMQDWSDM